jgi:hypothetical protein
MYWKIALVFGYVLMVIASIGLKINSRNPRKAKIWFMIFALSGFATSIIVLNMPLGL